MYTTYGPVRGCCGHRHKAYKTAKQCLTSDQASCHIYHGYSDREVVLIDNYDYLYHDNGDWIRSNHENRECGVKFQVPKHMTQRIPGPKVHLS